MSSPVIFSSVRAVLAQSFLDKIPCHVDKADFLKRTCKDFKITLDISDSNDMFSLEGQLNNIVSVEKFLQNHFVDWFFIKSHEQDSQNDSSVGNCPPSKQKVSMCTSFGKCTDPDVQSDLQSISEVLVSGIEEFTSPFVVSVVENSADQEVVPEVESTSHIVVSRFEEYTSPVDVSVVGEPRGQEVVPQVEEYTSPVVVSVIEECTGQEVVPEIESVSQIVVSQDSESHEICSEIIVTEDVQNIELIDSNMICESGDLLNFDDMCMDKSSLDHENEVYMDIQLSCRPHDGLFEESGNSPVSVIMGTEKSLMEAVCLESINNEELSFPNVLESNNLESNTLESNNLESNNLESNNLESNNLESNNLESNNLESNNLEKECSNLDDLKKIRSRKYEERAMFKYFCTQCSFKSKRQSHLIKHALLHERVCKLYSCDHCDFVTIRKGHLQRHVLQHSVSQFFCSACNFKTHSKPLLRKHQNLKHKVNRAITVEEKPVLQCSKCNYSTTKEKLFERHQTVHVSDTKKGKKKCFDCSKCSFKATSKSNLARHVKNIHMADRPFLCNICGQGFKRSDTLTQHLVIHAGNDASMKDLQCPHCQKYYRSKTLLHEHMLIHADTRSYLCELCGAAFKTRAVQRKHVRNVHSSSKLFPCTHCPKKFNCQFDVKRHVKLHESKTTSEATIESALKPIEPSSDLIDQWESSVVTMPIHEDVQVLVVQQDDVEQGVLFNEGAILVQGSTEVQMECTSDLSKAANVPALPEEYVLSENMASEVCSTTDLSDQFPLQDGEIITLEFVQ